MAESNESSPAENQTSSVPRLAGSDFSRLKRVGQGLGLICAAVLLEVVSAPLTLIAAFTLDTAQGWVFARLSLLFAISLLALAVGVCFCLTVPSRARAARFAIAAIALIVAGIVTIRITGHTPKTVGFSPLVNGCLLASAACFLWYLRRLAMFLCERNLARRALYLLIAMLAIYGSTFLGPFPKRVDGPSLDDHLSGIRTLVTVVTVLSYVGLIANLRKAVRWYARQSESANS